MTTTAVGIAAPVVVYATVLALHLLVPARRRVGYARDSVTGEPLTYRINGLWVMLATLSLWVLACSQGGLAWDALYVGRWASLATACVIGLLFTAAVVAGAPRTGKPWIADVFLGRRENPQWFARRVDAKMLLYLIGAVMLELNVLSAAAHHWAAFPDTPSPGVGLYTILFSWFVFDYLVFERVHLYTYDLFAERVGFKLGWGCLTFYPYFYAIGIFTVASTANPDPAPLLLVGAGVVFFTGWSLARGANMQKYFFKRDPGRTFLGIAPRVIEGGEHRLLASGFWGIARHVNYLGEILMGIGLALSLGVPESPFPWLYPLYYVLLLLPRERDDDRRCAAKYGELWERYRTQVPWRVIPGVY